MDTITKKELVERVCDRAGLSRAKAKEAIQEFLNEVVAELARGNRLEFREFGVFEIKTRAARTAQNPKTLKPVRVPAKRTVKFKVGRKLREALARLSDAPAPPSLNASNGHASGVHTGAALNGHTHAPGARS